MKKFIIVSMSLFLALLLNGKAILAQGNLTPLVINQPMQMNVLPKCTPGTEVTVSRGDKPNESLKLHSPSGKFIMHVTKNGELKLCIFCHEKINIEKI